MPRSVATARMLSDDILHLVFLHALPSIIAISYPLDPLTTPPLNFSAVCRSWRSVVSSSPSLWSTFRMGPQEPTHSNSYSIDLHPSVPHFVAMWFRNSKDAPLNIHLSLFRFIDDPVCEELLALFPPQYHRCKEIDFYMFINDRSFEQDPIRIRCPPSAVSVRAVCSSPRLHHAQAGAVCLDLTDFTTAGSPSQPSLQELSVSSGVKWLLHFCGSLTM